MGSTKIYDSETLLSDLGGCGKFQVFTTLLIQLSAIPLYFSININPFNVYNPGWKCLGNDTYNYNGSMTDNGTAGVDKVWTEYGMHSCQAFDACSHVEFSPEASTVLTQWGLACGTGWILSTMLAMRSAGDLCSTLIVGYVGDQFGRRLPYLFSRIVITCLSLATIYCETWQMYAVVMFLMGFAGSYSMLALTLMSEYVSPDWRIKIYSIPVWTIVSITFGVVCRYFPDWKTLSLIVVVSGAISILPMVVYLPESLRWVSVKGKQENLNKLITKIAKVNKAPMPSEAKIQSMIDTNQLEEKKPKYTMIDLFREGYRLPTIVLAFVSFVLEVVYYAFSFGVAALPGNFYNNLLIFSATDMPSNVLSFLFANRFPRKPCMITMFGCTTVSIFGIVAIDLLGTGDLKLFGTLVLVMVAKFFIYVGWIVLATSRTEVYPTVVRSTVNGFTAFFSGIGGIVAPYLIPSDPSTYYINYLVMAFLTLLCTCSLFFIPETKGQPLKDRWDDGKSDSADGPEVFTIDSHENKHFLKPEKL